MSTVDELREQVRQEKNLSETQAKRLVGTTRDELSADADQLLVDLGVSTGAGQAGNRGAAGLAEAKRRFGDQINSARR